MICTDCRTAGKFNYSANAQPDQGVAASYRQHAREAHQKCPGGCDCQHVVGQSVTRVPGETGN